MSGQLNYFKNSHENPEYTCVLFGFKNHCRLAYESRRKLGRIYLVDDADAFIEKKGLGPDALECDFGTFEEVLSSQKKAVKAALMDQHRLAGIGNIYSDEILFQARISPTIAVNRLGRKARNKLFRAVEKVLQTAIDRKANPDHLPSSYLIPHRQQGRQMSEVWLSPKEGRHVRPRLLLLPQGSEMKQPPVAQNCSDT